MMRGRTHMAIAVCSMGGGIVVFDMKLLNQRGEAAQEGQWTVAIRGRPEDSESVVGDLFQVARALTGAFGERLLAKSRSG